MSELLIQNIDSSSEKFLKFIELWGEEIEDIFPDFSVHEISFSNILLLSINNEAAGLFIYQAKGEELQIDIDYLVEKYRNQDIGNRFFREKIETFRREGFERIVSATDNQLHQEYLLSLGFINSKKHDSRFELIL